MISPSQCRAARSFLNITQDQLADATEVQKLTILNFEKEKSSCHDKTLRAIENYFKQKNLAFTENGGVEPLREQILTLKGREGFWQFLDDVYETVKYGGEINVINVVDEDFVFWAKDKHSEHIERMSEIENLRCRTLCKEGYTNFVSTEYSQYRWLKEKNFSAVPFYMYGDKLAIMMLEPEPLIFLIKSQEVSAAYRIQFMALWDNSLEPKVMDDAGSTKK